MSATSLGFVRSSRQTSSTGRPRSLPFALTFSCQIWWASRAVLPFDARAPESDRQYPILSGVVSIEALLRGHAKHDLAVRSASCRSRPIGRHPMNPWQVPGDVLPGLGRILERVHGRDVWSYRLLFQQSRDSAEHVR